MLLKQLLAAVVVLGVASAAAANDAAASTAMGGIQLRREARVTMQRERLFISTRVVRVEYEFLNESEQDITTEVAFPIPRYAFDYHLGGENGFDDFRVWVEGKELHYQVQVQASHRGVDCSALLRRHKVDPATFGHFDYKRLVAHDFQQLSAGGRAELAAAGLISGDNLPNWAVQKTYYWTQTFPARKVLHVRHEYSPVLGYSQITPEQIDEAAARARNADSNRSQEPYGELGSYAEEPDVTYRWVQPHELMEHACVNADMARRVRADAEPKMRAARAKDDWHVSWVHWVDYILTTANTWKMPIKDFELVVARPKGSYVSFCWDGPIERRAPSRLAVRATDFVPQGELHVAFLEP